MLIAIIKKKICLADLKPEHCDEIKFSIMAARCCGFPKMEKLVSHLHIDTGVVIADRRYYWYLILDWLNLVALVTILDEKQSEQFMNSRSYRLLDEIIELLTCAVEMKLATKT